MDLVKNSRCKNLMSKSLKDTIEEENKRRCVEKAMKRLKMLEQADKTHGINDEDDEVKRQRILKGLTKIRDKKAKIADKEERVQEAKKKLYRYTTALMLFNLVLIVVGIALFYYIIKSL